MVPSRLCCGGTPIEHLLELKKKKLEDRPCRNMDELKDTIFQTWQSITPEEMENLVSMPQRCAAVIKSKGGIRSTLY